MGEAGRMLGYQQRKWALLDVDDRYFISLGTTWG